MHGVHDEPLTHARHAPHAPHTGRAGHTGHADASRRAESPAGRRYLTADCRKLTSAVTSLAVSFCPKFGGITPAA
jgi:hypothetical protein